jgi:WD40 repeat protein
MIVRILSLPLVGAGFLLALSIWADQPAAPADDPLPKGAKVRYGVTRPILRTSPGVALLPPGYTNFLAPTMTGGIRRYDLGTGRPLQKDGIVGPGQVIVSADGKRAAVARPGLLTVVEVATGKEILAITPPDGVLIVGVPGVSLSADGKWMAYAGRGKEGKGEVVVCEVDKNETVAQVETSQAAPVYPTLSRDGKTLVTHGPPAAAPTLTPAKKPAPTPLANADALRTAQVWEVATSKELFKARVTGMGGIVVAAALSHDGDLLALSAGDGPIDLWDVKTGKRTQTLLGRKGQGVRVAISPDGKTIASVGPDYRVQRWAVDGEPLGISEPPPGVLIAQITGLTFRDNERTIAWVTAAQFACAWEGPATKLLSPTMDHAAGIRSIAFPKDEKSVVTSGLDGRIFRWDFNTGALSEEINVRPARLPAQPLVRPIVNLSGDFTRAAWLRTPIEVFDMDTGEDLFSIPSPSSPPAGITMNTSPDGLKLITVSRQAGGKRTGSCVVWDLMTQQRMAEFDVPGTAGANAPLAVLSPGGHRLVLVSLEPTDAGPFLRVTGFDMKTGKKLAEAEEPMGAGAITISLAAASETSVVLASNLGRVWSVDFMKGKVQPDIDRIVARGDPPICGPVVFSPDGKRFATGVVDAQFTTYGVRVYDWPQRKVLHTFIGHAGPITALRFSPDGNYLASGAQDTSAILWDLSTLEQPR